MAAWASQPETPGVSPPGLALHTHGASQPVGDGVVTCPALRIVSFNFGIEQNMLTSERQWAQKHVYKFRDLLRSMGNTFSHDFIFGSEMGGVDQGFDEARICMKHIVNDALPGAACASSGAYLSVWNIKTPGAAAVVEEGTWTAPIGHRVHMRWQAFEITFLLPRDASQLAGHDASELESKKVGFIVGNMHTPVPNKGKGPKTPVKRSIVKSALTHLALTFVNGAWAKEMLVPVGFNYENRGMRNDDHDAVSAMLLIPLTRQPGGASQPAEDDELPDWGPRERTNKAIIAYGHGTVRRADGQTLAIGGSTGGLTRRLLDGNKETNVEAFLSPV